MTRTLLRGLLLLELIAAGTDGSVTRLAAAAGLDKPARPHLIRLRQAVEETVHLGVMEEDRVVREPRLRRR